VLMPSVMIHETTNRKSTQTTLKVYVLQKMEKLKPNKGPRAKEMKKKQCVKGLFKLFKLFMNIHE
jgi:hypothetical protein